MESPNETLRKLEREKLTIYNPLVIKDDEKGDWVNCFGVNPIPDLIYHGSDIEYLTTARPISFG